jgi:uncharacterized protein (DUF302 family)
MYGYKKEVKLAYDKAVARVREELAKEGFGVLTEVDVKAVLKKKLNADYDDYIILGACNPPFAYQSLQITKDAGLMMPCNVVVYTEKGKTFILSTLPTMLMNLIQNDKLKSTAEQIESKLKAAVDRVG